MAENIRWLKGDLRHPRWMIAKAVLFLGVWCICCAILLARMLAEPVPSLTPLAGISWTIGLYSLGTWSACRAYYFAFYVITAYCNPAYRYSGIASALRWCVRKANIRSPHDYDRP